MRRSHWSSCSRRLVASGDRASKPGRRSRMLPADPSKVSLWIDGMSSTVQSSRSSSSCLILLDRCGAANSTPSGAASSRAFAITAKSSTVARGIGSCQPCHSCSASHAGTTRSRLSAWRTGTSPAVRCNSPPAVSAAITTLTGSIHASKALSTSATLVALSNAGNVSNPIRPVTRGGYRRLMPSPTPGTPTCMPGTPTPPALLTTPALAALAAPACAGPGADAGFGR